MRMMVMVVMVMMVMMMMVMVMVVMASTGARDGWIWCKLGKIEDDMAEDRWVGGGLDRGGHLLLDGQLELRVGETAPGCRQIVKVGTRAKILCARLGRQRRAVVVTVGGRRVIVARGLWLADRDAHADLDVAFPLDLVLIDLDKVGLALGLLGEVEKRVDVVVVRVGRLVPHYVLY